MADKEEREFKTYDLDVTAEERGYEVGEPLSPENELKEDSERLGEPSDEVEKVSEKANEVAEDKKDSE